MLLLISINFRYVSHQLGSCAGEIMQVKEKIWSHQSAGILVPTSSVGIFFFSTVSYSVSAYFGLILRIDCGFYRDNATAPKMSRSEYFSTAHNSIQIHVEFI
jgi:hypothetical protein